MSNGSTRLTLLELNLLVKETLAKSLAGSYWVVGVFAETTGAAGPVVINDCAPYLVKIVTGSGVTDVAGVKSSFDGADRVKFV